MLETVYIVNMKVKVTQSRPTLCDPTGYTVHGILQVRTLELPNLVVKTAILFIVMVTGNSSICILACTLTSFPALLGTSFIYPVPAF